MNIRRILLLTATITIGALQACNSSESGEQQLIGVVTSLKRSVEKAGAGDVVRAPIYDLHHDQVLVVINASYAGSIEPSQHVSEKLATEITLYYGGKEVNETFLLLLDKNEIIASLGVPGDSFFTAFEPVGNNARISTPDKRVAILSCAGTGLQRNIDASSWNKNCQQIILNGFEAE